jgi:malonate-semialdehyde dehydrogenase (acetylating)/methylmalonate-semialdehyde dehydrogenase
MPSNARLSAMAQPIAEKLSADWKGTNMTGGKTRNFINGEFVESKTDQWLDVNDPVGQSSRPRLPKHLTD